MSAGIQALLREGDPEQWIDALPGYQRSIISTMSQEYELEEVAVAWLTTSGSKDTAPFGGVKAGATLLYKNVLLEMQKLLCGDPQYDTERKQLFSAGEITRATVISGASVAVAPLLGSSAVLIAPVVALVFVILARAGVATACQGLTELLEEDGPTSGS